MPGPLCHEPPNVLEHYLLRHDEEAPVVHRRDRAMRAVMQTTTARFDITHHPLLAIILEPCVMFERHKRAAVGRGEIEASKHGLGCVAASAHFEDVDWDSRFDCFDKFDERFFKLATD